MANTVAGGTGKVAESRYLAFKLLEEEYAIPLLKAQEVVGMLPATPVPFAPSYFKGLINLHGRIISVIDLRMKFSMSGVDQKNEANIIVLDMGSYSMGVVVDGVTEVYNVKDDEVNPTPEVEGSVKVDFITGVIHRNEGLVLLIDIAKTRSGRAHV